MYIREEVLRKIIEHPSIVFEQSRGKWGFYREINVPSQNIKKLRVFTLDDFLELIPPKRGSLTTSVVKSDKGLELVYSLIEGFGLSGNIEVEQQMTGAISSEVLRGFSNSYNQEYLKLINSLKNKELSNIFATAQEVVYLKNKVDEGRVEVDKDSKLRYFVHFFSRNSVFKVTRKVIEGPIMEVKVTSDQSKYVFELTTHPYILYNWRGGFYKMPPTRIWADINKKTGDMGNPQIFSEPRHPFQSGTNMCIVKRRATGLSGKALYRTQFSDAVGTAVGGYTPGCNPYVNLNASNFSSAKISKRDAKILMDAGKVYVDPLYRRALG